jgi:probable HAF family extracellular repeat protein
MYPLPFPGAQSTLALAVAHDGLVVGQAVINGVGYAAYWDEEGAHQIFSVPSMATSISLHGHIVGWTRLPDRDRVVPFVKQGEMLLYLPEPSGSVGACYAYAVSGNGRVVAGIAMMPDPTPSRWRIISARGIVWNSGYPSELEALGGGFGSQANALSYDGLIVAGSATVTASSLNRRATLWVGGVPELIGTLGGETSVAWGIDGAGRQVVGSSQTATGENRAFYWTRETGIVELQTHFARYIPAGWVLRSANAISPNGRYIVGTGVNPSGAVEAWLLDTGFECSSYTGDTNGDACVDDADLLAVLFAFGGTGGAEDVNCDGSVDDADLLTVLFNFGSGC